MALVAGDAALTSWDDAQTMITETQAEYETVWALSLTQCILGVIPFVWWPTASLQWTLALVSVILFGGISLNYQQLAEFFLNEKNYDDPAMYEMALSNRKVAYANFDSWNLTSYSANQLTMAEFETGINWEFISTYTYMLVLTPIMFLLIPVTFGLSFFWFWTLENVLLSWALLIRLLIGDPAQTIMSWLPKTGANATDATDAAGAM